jgi:hypothetical protein
VLLKEQTDLLNHAESVSATLSYYTEINRLSLKINSPSFSVLSDQFVPLLAHLDECISYLTQHPHYMDSAHYLIRYQQCQGRALNLVKLHVNNTLKMAAQNVITQVQGTDYQAQHGDTSPSLSSSSSSSSFSSNPSGVHVVGGSHGVLPSSTTVSSISSPDSSFTLFYGKFRTHAPRIKV